MKEEVPHRTIIELLRMRMRNVLDVPVTTTEEKAEIVKLVQFAFVDCVCRSRFTATFVVWLFGECKCIA